MEILRKIWKSRELRGSILFVLAMLVFFRFAAQIPIPGVDAAEVKALFGNNSFLGLLNTFTGGGLKGISIVMLGVGPYITASIIFQLLTMVVPRLEELSKEGEYGQRKINQYTRLAAVPAAMLQGFGTLTLLKQSIGGSLAQMSVYDTFILLITATAGSMMLLWIGELITEKRIGNGVSLMIFAGIVAGLPTEIQGIASLYDSSQLPQLIAFIAILVLTVIGIVFVTDGQRNIPVSYARRIRGDQAFGGVNSYLPLRVNQAGVIPIIFALSLLLFPSFIGQIMIGSSTDWIADLGRNITILFQNQLFYGGVYFLLVVAFTYFYTAVVFQPLKVAENLQKQGGFIPGIRPGMQTAEYVGKVSNRIMLAGAVFLGALAVIPLAVQSAFGWQLSLIGGTSVLIVVSVVQESIKQISAQLDMRTYDA